MTPIDNFDIVKSLIDFEEKDNLFVHVQVLRRGKDHPDLPAANKLIKAWVVRSRKHLDKIKEEVVFLCEHYKARAYISCAPKSLEKLNTLIMLKLADNQHTGNIINPWHVFNSACGELQGVEKRWVMDVDTKDSMEIEFIIEMIGELWEKAHPQDKGESYEDTWLLAGISTLNGVHLIVRPFNLQEFKKRFPDVEAKKNGLTALYVPECITKEKAI
ncbi:MAG: hypothetical protein K2M59_06895 [Muribaculaceae bacterium]|nr:hypothetical protein [Muribaculaceae bacterium]